MRKRKRPHNHMRCRVVSHIKISDAIHTKSRNDVEQEYNALVEEEKRPLPFALDGQRIHLKHIVVAERKDDPRDTANRRSHKETEPPDSTPSDFRKIRILASSFKPTLYNQVDTLLIYNWNNDSGTHSAEDTPIVGKNGSVRLTVLPEPIEVDPETGTMTLHLAL